jgi:hypothetical protein
VETEALDYFAVQNSATGGELEQIHFLFGHVWVETAERYLSCMQRLRSAINDRIGLES